MHWQSCPPGRPVAHALSCGSCAGSWRILPAGASCGLSAGNLGPWGLSAHPVAHALARPARWRVLWLASAHPARRRVLPAGSWQSGALWLAAGGFARADSSCPVLWLMRWQAGASCPLARPVAGSWQSKSVRASCPLAAGNRSLPAPIALALSCGSCAGASCGWQQADPPAPTALALSCGWQLARPVAGSRGIRPRRRLMRWQLADPAGRGVLWLAAGNLGPWGLSAHPVAHALPAGSRQSKDCPRILWLAAGGSARADGSCPVLPAGASCGWQQAHPARWRVLWLAAGASCPPAHPVAGSWRIRPRRRLLPCPVAHALAAGGSCRPGRPVAGSRQSKSVRASCPLAAGNRGALWLMPCPRVLWLAAGNRSLPAPIAHALAAGASCPLAAGNLWPWGLSAHPARWRVLPAGASCGSCAGRPARPARRRVLPAGSWQSGALWLAAGGSARADSSCPVLPAGASCGWQLAAGNLWPWGLSAHPVTGSWRILPAPTAYALSCGSCAGSWRILPAGSWQSGALWLAAGGVARADSSCPVLWLMRWQAGASCPLARPVAGSWQSKDCPRILWLAAGGSARADSSCPVLWLMRWQLAIEVCPRRRLMPCPARWRILPAGNWQSGALWLMPCLVAHALSCGSCPVLWLMRWQLAHPARWQLAIEVCPRR